MPSKRQTLFVHPANPMLPFTDVLKEIYKLPLQEEQSSQHITADYSFNQEHYRLTCHARITQIGSDTAPTLIYLPWYGGKSIWFKRFLNLKQTNWTIVCIDIFNTQDDFNKILTNAVSSQYAYALVIRMIGEQINRAHKNHKRVGVVGFSYGANVLSAYITQGLELPDAVVAVEGGSILDTTLYTKYQGNDTDSKTLAILKEDPASLPLQKPLGEKAANISAAVLNISDKVVLGQEELWKDSASKMYINGGHFTALLFNRSRVRGFMAKHLRELLVWE
ncbi:MAG TPA: hypothetical protein VNX65_04280 [Patescibacteria group bacterium]|jgi:hypothetical protein|nr:hypothetical protein [Patescibacteria group bacterium]